jgi:4'-phosphopantetheinyl transferase EntD
VHSPARLSVQFQVLFPRHAVVAEMREAGDGATLLPGEVEYVERAVPKRVKEFAAGRACARLAMASFGVADFALRVAADRQPVWPAGIVGSISHTAGLCLAVVAEHTRVAALGIDCEVVGHVNADIWETICTATELAWLASLPTPLQAAAVALLFSAKEAVYKCQYPLTREWMDFHDLEASPDGFGGPRGTLCLTATRALKIQQYPETRLTVEYLLHEGYVTTGMTIERS